MTRELIARPPGVGDAKDEPEEGADRGWHGRSKARAIRVVPVLCIRPGMGAGRTGGCGASSAGLGERGGRHLACGG